ncbi:MAG: serine protease [Candidatus Parabeggiatoa sp. nov. 1]|nr:MAG: serine protease [Gammaproteobacteria bacterium]
MSLKYKLVLFALTALMFIGCSREDESSSSSAASVSRFTIQGRMLVGSNTATDDDVNNASTLENANDSMYTAQRIPNPVILGGYVNQPGAGPTGRSQEFGDKDDFFEVDLRAGQIITLFVADQNLLGNDLDLALRDNEGLILNASVGDGKTERVIVPEDGRYFIQVQAYLGASNYVLSIGQNITTTSLSLRLSDDFAVGKAIVRLSPQHTVQAQSAIATLGLQTQSQEPSRRQLFSFEPNLSRVRAADNMRFATPELCSKYETLLAIKQLRGLNHIIEASPNYRLQALRIPNDTLHRHQWGHSLINLPQAWDVTIGDSSVIVAVIDTGVLLKHPDLRTKLVEGYDFVASRYDELDSDRGIDPDPDDPGDQFPGGSTFHGTHVAGIAAALTDNNEGIAGVGWQTLIMPLRVLGKGGGFDYDIEQALRFAAGLPNDSGTVPTRRADIINLSLGGRGISSGFQDLITEVRNAGVIVVASAGNEDSDIPIYPASLEGVISVGAVNINKQRASYSNFGKDIDVVAPGGGDTADINGDGLPDEILSTMGDDQRSGKLKLEFSYDYMMGTSMAAPHIAGVMSLMKAVNPALTPQNFDDLLKSGQITDNLGPDGRDDEFGYGLINAQKAVLAAIELGGGKVPEPPPPRLVVNPKSLNFGLNRTTALLTLSNGGGGDLQVVNISDDAGGFLAIEGDGLGDYLVTVNRSSLSMGTFTAIITITSSVNTVEIPVILQVGDSNATGDAGLHSILLIDAGTLETKQEFTVSAKEGVYHFSFSNLSAGKYIIVAGSDFNNDGFICDDGEACGAFLTLDRPTSIEVPHNLTEIEFNTSFNANFLTTIATSGASRPSRQGFARFKPRRLASQ